MASIIAGHVQAIERSLKEATSERDSLRRQLEASKEEVTAVRAKCQEHESSIFTLVRDLRKKEAGEKAAQAEVQSLKAAQEAKAREDAVTKAERDKFKEQCESQSALFAEKIASLTATINAYNVKQTDTLQMAAPAWKFKAPPQVAAPDAASLARGAPLAVGCENASSFSPDAPASSSHSSSPEKARGTVDASPGVAGAHHGPPMSDVQSQVKLLLEREPPAAVVEVREQAAAVQEQQEQQVQGTLAHAQAVEYVNRRKWRAQRDVLHAGMTACGGECRLVWLENYPNTKAYVEQISAAGLAALDVGGDVLAAVNAADVRLGHPCGQFRPDQLCIHGAPRAMDMSDVEMVRQGSGDPCAADGPAASATPPGGKRGGQPLPLYGFDRGPCGDVQGFDASSACSPVADDSGIASEPPGSGDHEGSGGPGAIVNNA